MGLKPNRPARRPLRFGRGNAKLNDGIFTFSLPAGHSCPFARSCRSRADPNDGTITDGRGVEFRCYAASMEARHPTVRRSRWHNLRELRRCRSSADMARLILDSLTPFAGYVRVHDSGDFFSLAYLDAWLAVARERPRTRLYWYSKAIPTWAARLDDVGTGREPGRLPNVVPTASLGGAADELAGKLGLRTARVVFSQQEADRLGLEIDHDDSHAMSHGPDFALLVHGSQPAGSQAAEAVRALRSTGTFSGYGERWDKLPLAVVR